MAEVQLIAVTKMVLLFRPDEALNSLFGNSLVDILFGVTRLIDAIGKIHIILRLEQIKIIAATGLTMKKFTGKRMLALGGALALSTAMFSGVAAYAATPDDSTEVIAQVEEAVEDGIHEAQLLLWI